MNEYHIDEALSDDFAVVAPLESMHTGLLTHEERKAFNRLVSAGLAKREYSGVAGFLGLATVRMVRT